MLVKAGANVNTVEKFQQPNAFDVGCRRAKKCGRDGEAAAFQRRRRQASRAVLPTGRTRFPRSLALSIVPSGDLTALLYAARDGCYDCVEALIGAGADVNVPTPEGVTPLMIALDNDTTMSPNCCWIVERIPHVCGLVGTHGPLHRHR